VAVIPARIAVGIQTSVMVAAAATTPAMSARVGS
jgi:hypothetical protein